MYSDRSIADPDPNCQCFDMEKRHLHIETTALCPRVPVLLFAAEELGLAVELTVRPTGYLLQQYDSVGPILHDEGKTLVGLDDALLEMGRDLNDREYEELVAAIGFHVKAVRPALLALVRREPQALARMERCLDEVDARVHDEPSPADWLEIPLMKLPSLGVSLSAWPRLEMHTDQIAHRATWKRTVSRLAQLRG